METGSLSALPGVGGTAAAAAVLVLRFASAGRFPLAFLDPFFFAAGLAFGSGASSATTLSEGRRHRRRAQRRGLWLEEQKRLQVMMSAGGREMVAEIPDGQDGGTVEGGRSRSL